MKKLISALFALVLATSLQAEVINTTVDIPLGNGTIKMEVVLTTGSYVATIGTGYNACIPQYSEGKLQIPSTITYNNQTYTVTAIANVAFRFCTQLTEVEIEEGVTTIGNYAFVGCSGLEAISLPATLTTIGSGAFCGLSKLNAIKVCAEIPPTWSWYDVLQVDGGTDEVNSQLRLYVPDGYQSAYLAAKQDYSWTCMNTSSTPYTWGLTETRSQVGWGSYFNANTILTLEQWNQHLSINIFTVDDLKDFRDMVNAGTTYKDYIITLEADLDLNNEAWTPIGRVDQNVNNYYYDFCGTFDGKGHTIKNLNVTGDWYSSNLGLFGGTRDATIKNLIVEDASVQGYNFYVGTVIGHAEGTTHIHDVYVKNCTVSGKCFTGGIIGGAVNYDHGENCDLQMSQCVIEGGEVKSIYNQYLIWENEQESPFWDQYPYYGTVGGLVGYVDYANVQNCANLNTKVAWETDNVSEMYVESLNNSVTRGALIGYQQNNAITPPAMSNCYVLLHPENSLTATDYLVSAHKDYLDPDRYYGNASYSGGVTHWSYDETTLANSGNASDLNGLQLQSKLGTAAWGYTDGQLPLPGYFAYMFGEIPVNKVAYLPYGTEIDAPNYLTLTESGNAYTANSILVNKSFVGLDELPLGASQITVANGVVNEITFSATTNGTQDVTTEYPVYVKDENNMLVLDPHGNPVQATNTDGSPKTEPVTETVNTYTPKGYTLYLPYSITLSGDCKVYEPTSWDADANMLNFTRVENNVVEAYKPYYVVVNKGEVSLNTYTEHVIETQSTHSVTLADGSFNIIEALDGDSFFIKTYYIFNNGQWEKTSILSSVDAFNFYIQSNQASPGESFGINLIDNTVIDLAVTGHGESNGGWAFIASPVADDIAPSVVENLEGVKYETGTYNYDLYRFNQSADLEWENYHSHDTQENPFMLENGKGYLYASKNDKALHFSGPFNTDNTKTVNLEYDANAEFAGWNLVGNPFPVQAWVNKSHYTMNSEGTGLVANEVASSTPIPPLTGVMMQTTSTIGESVTFSTTEPEQQSANNGSLQIALSQANTRSNALLDNAIVSFNEGSQLGKYYFGRQNANIYLPQGGEEYAIVSVGRDGARNVSIDKDVARYLSTEIPLNFKASENGTYTISVNPQGVEMEYLHLIDNLTGADVDLLAPNHEAVIASDSEAIQEPASYTFTARTTDYASRFRLVFSGPADWPSADTPSFAYYADGEIRINEADARGASLQMVDVTGRVIISTDVARNVSTDGMTPGVYVLRLVNGVDVRTQKIVID